MDYIGTYTEKTFPKIRQITIEMGEQAILRHHVKGLIELDVTKGREYIQNYKKQTGERLSFTGWIMKCIGQAVSDHKHVHALQKGKKLIIFDDVDISVIVEKVIEGEIFPVVVVVRKVNEKSVKAIHSEIRTAQHQTQEEYLNKKETKQASKFVSLPKIVRKWFFWRKIKKDPFFVKKTMGTVSVTSVGMFGKLRGWAIQTNIGQTLAIALGGITKKPGVVGEEIKIREYLCMTILFDHDVVDGAPVARFIARLAELVENAYGLDNAGL